MHVVGAGEDGEGKGAETRLQSQVLDSHHPQSRLRPQAIHEASVREPSICLPRPTFQRLLPTCRRPASGPAGQPPPPQATARGEPSQETGEGEGRAGASLRYPSLCNWLPPFPKDHRSSRGGRPDGDNAILPVWKFLPSLPLHLCSHPRLLSSSPRLCLPHRPPPPESFEMSF